MHATEELAQQAGTAAARSTAHAADWAAEKVHDGASSAGRGVGRAAGKTAAVAERTVTAAEETVGAVVGAPAALGRAVSSAAHRVVDEVEEAADSVVGAVKGNIQAASDKVTDAEDAFTNKVDLRLQTWCTCSLIGQDLSSAPGNFTWHCLLTGTLASPRIINQLAASYTCLQPCIAYSTEVLSVKLPPLLAFRHLL